MKGQSQLDKKNTAGAHGYSNAKVWASLDDAVPSLRDQPIDLAILGVPPHFRGSTLPEADLDIRLISKYIQQSDYPQSEQSDM